MLYRKKIPDIFQIHTKHINTLCVQNIEMVYVVSELHIFTSGFRRLNLGYKTRQLFLYRQVIAVYFSYPPKTHKYPVWAERGILKFIPWL
jgi:hypothetical protein